ncbi:MAG: carboxypeptidase-like regulatory domain-containing protein [Gemmatimonadaceae bacterium]
MLATAANAQQVKPGTLRGTIASVTTTRAVAQAEVRIIHVDSMKSAGDIFLDSARTRLAVSDSAGAFLIGDVTPGNYVVSVRRIGFEPLEAVLRMGETILDMELALTSVAPELPEVKVTAASTTYLAKRLDGVGFTRRSKDGNTLRVHGPDEIASKHAFTVESLLEGWGYTPGDVYFLDGLPTEWRDLIRLPMEVVAAIEEYRNMAMAPAEFTRTLPGRLTLRDVVPVSDDPSKRKMSNLIPVPPKRDDGTEVTRGHIVLLWTYIP